MAWPEAARRTSRRFHPSMPTMRPSPRLLDELRALPRPFWVLFAGTFVNRFGTFVWPFLTIYLTRQGHSLTAAATAVGAFGFGSVAGSILGGWLSDHLGRRNTIVLGSTAAAGCVMLLYAADSLPAVIFSTLLMGMANATYHPAASALLADVVPEALRVRAYAAFRLAANAGFACGAALGGVLANYSFFWLFAGDALTTLGYAAVALAALPHGLRGQTRQAPWPVALRVLRGDRAFHALFASVFLSTLIFIQFGTTYSLHVTRAELRLDLLGWKVAPEAIYGLLIGWNGFMVALCELPLTRWTQRFDPARVMAVGKLLLGGGFALNAFAHSFELFFVAMTVFTLGEIVSAPITSAYIARLAPEPLRGRYLGALALAWNTAGLFGPYLGSRLFQWAPEALWAACAVLGLVSAAVMLRGSVPAREREAPVVAESLD
jgi:MFS family permease